MNIYLRELKVSKKSLIIWSIFMIMFVAMGLQKYEAFTISGTSMAEFTKMIDAMPKIIQTMWGVSTFDITTPIGYFGLLYPYLLLIASIHAGMFGSNIISKEERDKTAEFLITKPVSRKNIITAKILTGLTNIVIFNIVTFITTLFMLKNITTEPILNQMLLCSGAMFILQLLFMIIGVGMSAISGNYKKTGNITIFILLGTYFLSLFIDMSERLEVLRLITPFKYFDAKDFLLNNKLNIGYIILTLSIISVLIITSYTRYDRRDLNI